MPSVTVRCQTDGSACPPGHTRMRIVVGFVPRDLRAQLERGVRGDRQARHRHEAPDRGLGGAAEARGLHLHRPTCRKPYLGAVLGARWLTAGDGVHVQATTRDRLVDADGVRQIDVDGARAAGRNTPRLADGAGNAIVPRPPPTSKSAAGPKREYVPPVVAAPQPSTTVRPNASEAMVAVATARNVAVYAVSATGCTACTVAPPSDHDCELVGLAVQSLRSCGDARRPTANGGVGERGRADRRADREGQSGRRGGELQLHGRRRDLHGRRRLEPAGIGGRQLELEERRVLVVRGDDGSSGDAGVLLDGMGVAGRRRDAVVEDQRPAEGRRAEGAAFRVGGPARERDHVADAPARGGDRRRDGRLRGSVARSDDDRVGRLEARRVAHAQHCRDAARNGVRAIDDGRRTVVELSVAVEIPGIGERVAVGIRGTAPVEADVQRHGAAGRCRGRIRDRRAVATGVLDAPDRATVEVDVEEVATRADLQVDRIRCVGPERLAQVHVGHAARARTHDPDAVAGVVGEEERPLVGGRVSGTGVEGEP